MKLEQTVKNQVSLRLLLFGAIKKVWCTNFVAFWNTMTNSMATRLWRREVLGTRSLVFSADLAVYSTCSHFTMRSLSHNIKIPWEKRNS